MCPVCSHMCRGNLPPLCQHVSLVLVAVCPCMLQGLTFHISAHRPTEYIHMSALMPANLKKLTLMGPGFTDTNLAALARLTQLMELCVDHYISSPRALPQLPALT